jgi:hypothetical protein
MVFPSPDLFDIFPSIFCAHRPGRRQEPLIDVFQMRVVELIGDDGDETQIRQLTICIIVDTACGLNVWRYIKIGLLYRGFYISRSFSRWQRLIYPPAILCTPRSFRTCAAPLFEWRAAHPADWDPRTQILRYFEAIFGKRGCADEVEEAASPPALFCARFYTYPFLFREERESWVTADA